MEVGWAYVWAVDRESYQFIKIGWMIAHTIEFWESAY